MRPLVRQVSIVGVSAASIVLVALGIELALEPALGPNGDEGADRPPFAWSLPHAIVSMGPAEHSGCGWEEEPPELDVNRALRSDESTDPEPEPEGTGPARRRYVRPEPLSVTNGGVIPATATLVSNAGNVSARRRPRNPVP